MRVVRRLLSSVLALILALSVAAPAVAADGEGGDQSGGGLPEGLNFTPLFVATVVDPVTARITSEFMAALLEEARSAPHEPLAVLIDRAQTRADEAAHFWLDEADLEYHTKFQYVPADTHLLLNAALDWEYSGANLVLRQEWRALITSQRDSLAEVLHCPMWPWSARSWCSVYWWGVVRAVVREPDFLFVPRWREALQKANQRLLADESPSGVAVSYREELLAAMDDIKAAIMVRVDEGNIGRDLWLRGEISRFVDERIARFISIWVPDEERATRDMQRRQRALIAFQDDPMRYDPHYYHGLAGKVERLLGEYASSPLADLDQARAELVESLTDYKTDSHGVDEALIRHEAVVLIGEWLWAGKATMPLIEFRAALQMDDGDLRGAAQTLLDGLGRLPREQKAYLSPRAYLLLDQVRAELGDAPLLVLVNGREPAFDVPPVVQDDRTLVPLRAIAEAMGADVLWDGAARRISINLGGSTVELTLDSAVATVDGRPVTLDAPARSVNGRTLVPIRFLAEGLRQAVTWYPQSRMIVVTDQPLVGP